MKPSRPSTQQSSRARPAHHSGGGDTHTRPDSRLSEVSTALADDTEHHRALPHHPHTSGRAQHFQSDRISASSPPPAHSSLAERHEMCQVIYGVGLSRRQFVSADYLKNMYSSGSGGGGGSLSARGCISPPRTRTSSPFRNSRPATARTSGSHHHADEVDWAAPSDESTTVVGGQLVPRRNRQNSMSASRKRELDRVMMLENERKLADQHRIQEMQRKNKEDQKRRMEEEEEKKRRLQEYRDELEAQQRAAAEKLSARAVRERDRRSREAVERRHRAELMNLAHQEERARHDIESGEQYGRKSLMKHEAEDSERVLAAEALKASEEKLLLLAQDQIIQAEARERHVLEKEEGKDYVTFLREEKDSNRHTNALVESRLSAADKERKQKLHERLLIEKKESAQRMDIETEEHNHSAKLGKISRELHDIAVSQFQDRESTCASEEAQRKNIRASEQNAFEPLDQYFEKELAPRLEKFLKESEAARLEALKKKKARQDREEIELLIDEEALAREDMEEVAFDLDRLQESAEDDAFFSTIEEVVGQEKRHQQELDEQVIQKEEAARKLITTEEQTTFNALQSEFESETRAATEAAEAAAAEQDGDESNNTATARKRKGMVIPTLMKESKQKKDGGKQARLDALRIIFGDDEAYDAACFYEIAPVATMTESATTSSSPSEGGAGASNPLIQNSQRLTCGHYDARLGAPLTVAENIGHESQIFRLKIREDGYVNMISMVRATAGAGAGDAGDGDETRLAVTMDADGASFSLRKFDATSRLQRFELYPNDAAATATVEKKLSASLVLSNGSFVGANGNPSFASSFAAMPSSANGTENSGGNCGIIFSHMCKPDQLLEAQLDTDPLEPTTSTDSGNRATTKTGDCRSTKLVSEGVASNFAEFAIFVSNGANERFSPATSDTALAQRKEAIEKILGNMFTSATFAISPASLSKQKPRAPCLAHRKQDHDADDGSSSSGGGDAPPEIVQLRRAVIKDDSESFVIMDAGSGYLTIANWQDSKMLLTAPLGKGLPFTMEEASKSPRQLFEMSLVGTSNFVLQAKSHPSGGFVEICLDDGGGGGGDDESNTCKKDVLSICMIPTEHCEFALVPIETEQTFGHVTVSSRSRRDMKKKAREDSFKAIFGKGDPFAMKAFSIAPAVAGELRYTVFRDDGGVNKTNDEGEVVDAENNNTDEIAFEPDHPNVVVSVTGDVDDRDPAQKFKMLPAGNGFYALCPQACEGECLSVEVDNPPVDDDEVEHDEDGANNNSGNDAESTWSLCEFTNEGTEDNALFEVVTIGGSMGGGGDDEDDEEPPSVFTLRSKKYPNMVIEAQLDDEPMLLKLVRDTKATNFSEMELSVEEEL